MEKARILIDFFGPLLSASRRVLIPELTLIFLFGVYPASRESRFFIPLVNRAIR